MNGPPFAVAPPIQPRRPQTGLGPLPLTTGRGPSWTTSDQGVTVIVVLDALQLFASSVSFTTFVLSAHVST